MKTLIGYLKDKFIESVEQADIISEEQGQEITSAKAFQDFAEAYLQANPPNMYVSNVPGMGVKMADGETVRFCGPNTDPNRLRHEKPPLVTESPTGGVSIDAFGSP